MPYGLYLRYDRSPPVTTRRSSVHALYSLPHHTVVLRYLHYYWGPLVTTKRTLITTEHSTSPFVRDYATNQADDTFCWEIYWLPAWQSPTGSLGFQILKLPGITSTSAVELLRLHLLSSPSAPAECHTAPLKRVCSFLIESFRYLNPHILVD